MSLYYQWHQKTMAPKYFPGKMWAQKI